MRIIVDENKAYDNVEITIKCPSLTNELQQIISTLRLYNNTLVGQKEGKSYILNFDKIFYVDTIDRHTFIYTEKDTYESDLKLYRLEELLSETSFLRVNKSSILNIRKVRAVEGTLSGKLIALLKNGERIEISRMYAPIFKDKVFNGRF